MISVEHILNNVHGPTTSDPNAYCIVPRIKINLKPLVSDKGYNLVQSLKIIDLVI